MKGSDIQKLREAYELTRVELAELLCVQTSSVYRWEAEKKTKVKIEGTPRKLLDNMLDLRPAERKEVRQALRRGGWLHGLHALLSAVLKKAP